jgi:aldose 1-epimerase
VDDRFLLGDGRWSLLVAPTLGGSLLACEYDGVEVLKPVAQPAAGGRPAMRCCHFPLVPFSNRIENGRFDFNGRAIRHASNVPGSPHPMHGHGWQGAWRVAARDETRCTLSMHRDATPDWPWPYRAWQSVALEGGSVRLSLGIENAGAAAMPCGLGFHPFLPRHGDTRLAFEAAHVGTARAGEFAAGRIAVPAALDFRNGPRLTEREGVDHCFEGWARRALASGGPHFGALAVEGCAETPCVIVYVPTGENYYCIEPVTHAVNAMNLPDAEARGWWTLGRGGRREISMRITRRDS